MEIGRDEAVGIIGGLLTDSCTAAAAVVTAAATPSLLPMCCFRLGTYTYKVSQIITDS